MYISIIKRTLILIVSQESINLVLKNRCQDLMRKSI
jgi:hypothetical protein